MLFRSPNKGPEYCPAEAAPVASRFSFFFFLEISSFDSIFFIALFAELTTSESPEPLMDWNLSTNFFLKVFHV